MKSQELTRIQLPLIQILTIKMSGSYQRNIRMFTLFHCLSLIVLPQLQIVKSAMSSSRENENCWLSVMAELVIEKETLNPGDFVSWSAYHANRQGDEISHVSPTLLMPLFTEAAHRATMMTHAMKLAANAIQHLHPGQKPVLTMDQP